MIRVVAIALCLLGCSPSGVALRASAGPEWIDDDRSEWFVTQGVDVTWSGGFTTSLTHRYRRLEDTNQRHGMFFGVKVPVWRKR